MSIQKNNIKGITLLEMLVASSMAVVFIGGLYLVNSQFLHKVRASLHTHTQSVVFQRVRSFFTRDLKSCCDFIDHPSEMTGDSVSFEGTEYTLQFYTKNPQLVGPYSRELRGIYQVQYFLEETEDGYALIRKVVPCFTKTGKSNKEVVATSINFLSFEYFNGQVWQKKWMEETIPRGVRVLCSSDYPEHKERVFTVDIPFAVTEG